MQKQHQNPKTRKVLKEDPDSLKVRLNRLIDIGQYILIMMAFIMALTAGCFIRLLLLRS